MIRNIFFKRYLDIKEHCRTYILYFNRLRTPSVVQSNTDDKGRFVVGQTVVPEHNLQASRAKKRKQASVQAVYNQCYKQATKNQDKVFICSPHREFWLGNGIGKTFLWKNIFYSTNKDKIREVVIFEIVPCPFEG